MGGGILKNVFINVNWTIKYRERTITESRIVRRFCVDSLDWWPVEDFLMIVNLGDNSVLFQEYVLQMILVS